MERSETLTGSASTAASSETPSGMANSWDACAAKRSACAPAAAAQFPRWIEAGRLPERKLRHHGYRPSRQAPHGGSTPRGTQDSHGLRTTRSPVSARRPTTSWPSTCGKDTSAVSGLSREPFSRICFTSEPHRPEKVVSTRTQSCAGSGSSSTSSMRTGASRDTKTCRSTRPPMVAAASRARLCRNISAFTFTLPHGEPPAPLRLAELCGRAAVLFVDRRPGEGRAGEDVQGLQAHEVIPAAAQLRIRREAVRVAEPGAFELVADAPGVGEAWLPHPEGQVLPERLFRLVGEIVRGLVEHGPPDGHQLLQLVGGEVDVMSDPRAHARIALEELVHAVLITRQDDHELVAVILHDLEQDIDAFLAVVL